MQDQVNRKGLNLPLCVSWHKSSVRSQLLGQGIGYIRIAVFQTETSAEFKAAIKQLQDQGPLEGLVLDLRNNPGGLMPISVEVADTMIDQGLLLYTEGRTPDANKQYYATYGDLTNGAPIAVLINGGGIGIRNCRRRTTNKSEQLL